MLDANAPAAVTTCVRNALTMGRFDNLDHDDLVAKLEDLEARNALLEAENQELRLKCAGPPASATASGQHQGVPGASNAVDASAQGEQQQGVPADGRPSAKVAPAAAAGAATAEGPRERFAQTAVRRRSSTRRRSSGLTDLFSISASGRDLLANVPERIVQRTPSLQRASVVLTSSSRSSSKENGSENCSTVLALTVDDAPVMATALMDTVQRHKGDLADGVDAWALACGLSGKGAASLPVSVVLALVRAIVGDVVRLKKLARWGLAARLVGGLVVSYVDILSDLLVAVQFMNTPGLEHYSSWTFASLGIMVAMHAVQTIVLQPGKGMWREVLFALVGVKPIVETWRVLTGAPQQASHKFPPELILGLSRFTEVLCESLPQAALQAFVYLQTPEPTPLQRVSLLGSVAAAGYILAMVDYDMDTSAQYRNSEPSLYGMVPTRSKGHRHAGRRATFIFLGDALFVGGHLACRSAAVAMALTVTLAAEKARWLVPAWLVAECTGFNLARWLARRIFAELYFQLENSTFHSYGLDAHACGSALHCFDRRRARGDFSGAVATGSRSAPLPTSSSTLRARRRRSCGSAWSSFAARTSGPAPSSRPLSPTSPCWPRPSTSVGATAAARRPRYSVAADRPRPLRCSGVASSSRRSGSGSCGPTWSQGSARRCGGGGRSKCTASWGSGRALHTRTGAGGGRTRERCC